MQIAISKNILISFEIIFKLKLKIKIISFIILQKIENSNFRD